MLNSANRKCESNITNKRPPVAMLRDGPMSCIEVSYKRRKQGANLACGKSGCSKAFVSNAQSYFH